MNKKIQTHKKKLLIGIVGLILFVSSYNVTLAIPVSLVEVSQGVISQIINFIENRYHINSGSVRDSMEQLNVANSKGSAPEVKLFFTPSDPKPGEKITATALPVYFSNPKENNYFTWYLKQAGCDLCENNATSHACSSEQLQKCDENKDGRITVEDWKITAMRIIAQNGFQENTTNFNDTDDDGYKAQMGGDSNREPSTGYHCFLHDFSNGKNYEMVDQSGNNRCEHLFPNALLFINNRTHRHTTGDGVFKKEEEEFWGTNPEDPDTANNGNKDEANVAGLGIDKFTWNYMPGDQVGVVVEGLSLNPTKEDDASMMIMWALPKNKCEPEGTEVKHEHIKGYTVTIPTTTTELNDCLPNNLVDPRKEDQAHNLDLNLKYFPEVPNNDSSGDNLGDKLTIESHIANLSSDSRQVHYKWTIKTLKNGQVFSLNNDSWEDITTRLSNLDTIKLSKTEGIGVNSLNLYLNISEDDPLYNQIFTIKNPTYKEGYLRVYLEADEFFKNYDQNNNYTNSGKTDVIIKIISSSNKIEFFKPIIEDVNGKIQLRESDNVICNDNENKYICYVTQNEIIGAKVTHAQFLHNFHWSINQTSLDCNSNISPDCGAISSIVFFPITGEVGQKYNLNLIANDISQDNNGNSIGTGYNLQLARKILIINPYVKLVPEKGAESKLLGYYNNLYNDQSTEDKSKNIFQTHLGQSVTIKAEFHPDWIVNSINSSNVGNNFNNAGFWLDGQDVSLMGNYNPSQAQEIISTEKNHISSAELSFNVNKLINEVYNVGFKALYIPSSLTRKALNEIWGISQFDSQEKLLQDNIQIEVVANNKNQNQNTSFLNKTHKIFANVAAAAPQEIIFMLRIFLVGGLLLFIAGISLSLIKLKIRK